MVNYTAALEYINSKGVALTDAGLRSRIVRGTIPTVPAKPQAGSNRRIMFDLDQVDLWLSGQWQKARR